MTTTTPSRTTIHEPLTDNATGVPSCQMTRSYGTRCYDHARYLINPVSGPIHFVYACRHHLAAALDAAGRSAVSPLPGK